jgi:hypothetical protein
MVWNNSAWVVLSTGRANSPGLDLIKTQTIGSAVSSVTVSDAFSATYDAYKIIISGGVASTANNDFTMTLGSSTTGYSYGFIYNSYNSSVAGTGASNAAGWVYLGSLDTTTLSLNVELVNPFLAKNTTFQSATTRTGLTGTVSGLHTVASSFTAFTLTPAIGTMTGGTIAVYGYAK